METQVKLGKLSQQEIDKQIKGKTRPNFRTNRRKKNYLHQYRRIDGKELKEGGQKKGKEEKEDEEEEDDAKLIKLDPRVNLRKLSLYLPSGQK